MKRIYMKQHVINIATEFSRYPGGRSLSDGPHSGERFRKEFLLPVLQSGEHAIIQFDGARGYGSSFLEEAFGGLVRLEGVEPSKILDTFTLESSDESIVDEIKEYITDAGRQ
jgi:hypothetical protein